MFEDLLEKKRKIFGLDIGYNTLKVVELKKGGDNFNIIGFNESPVPPNSVQKNGIKGKPIIAKVIQKALISAKPHQISARAVCSALPESLVFTKIIKLPNMKKEDLDRAIPHEVAEFFPLPISELNLDWQIINPNNNTGKEMEILVIATPKTLVNDYMETITMAGLELVVLETKPIAAHRAILGDNNKETLILVDIGAETSGISIIEEGMIKITGTLKSGGNNITRSLSQELKIDIEEAEKIKKNNGLELGKQDMKNTVIINNLRPIIEEISEMIKYYQTRLKKDDKIEQIKLCGGSSRILNLDKFIEKELNIPTTLANPYTFIKNKPTELIPASEIMKYTTAIGLAMRDI